MTAFSHEQIWSGIDRLAARVGMSPSGLARAAGLDPTSFNPSKRTAADGAARPRWPSTESLAKVLAATGISFSDFAALATESRARRLPVIGLAQAGSAGFFDDAGFPVGHGWDEVQSPGVADEGAYALKIAGDSMAPVYRDGDRIIVSPAAEPRRGDRVVVKTIEGEVLAKEVERLAADTVELKSLNPDFPDRILDRKDIAWIARIVWASQ